MSQQCRVMVRSGGLRTERASFEREIEVVDGVDTYETAWLRLAMAAAAVIECWNVILICLFVFLICFSKV